MTDRPLSEFVDPRDVVGRKSQFREVSGSLDLLGDGTGTLEDPFIFQAGSRLARELRRGKEDRIQPALFHGREIDLESLRLLTQAYGLRRARLRIVPSRS